MDSTPQVISTRERFRGRVFSVRTDELRFPDGNVYPIDVIEHRGSYGVIATTADGSVVLVRQFRPAVGRTLWEIPAGTAEPGESVLDGARRELAEETGFRARSMRPLGTLYMTPGFCNEVMHFVHASDLEAGEQDLDDDERIDARTFTPAEARELTARGQVADAKTLLALLWLESNRGELVGERADNGCIG